MSQTKMVLDAWTHLPQEVRDLAAPIETEVQYQEALRLFEAVWDQVGETPNHPLGSLFVLLRDHITAYEQRIHPPATVAPERMLEFLMEQHNMTQTELAGILGITQGNVSRLMNGKTQFGVETIRVLASYFRVSPEVFIPSTQS